METRDRAKTIHTDVETKPRLRHKNMSWDSLETRNVVSRLHHCHTSEPSQSILPAPPN